MQRNNNFRRRKKQTTTRRRFGGQKQRQPRKRGAFNPSHLVGEAAATSSPQQADIQHSFTDFALDAVVQTNITARGYQTPTPIQDQVIPHILAERDVIGLASTGTGKTAAFLLPLINKIYTSGGRVLIMAPTRELAAQINTEFRLFAAGLKLHSTLLIGGASMNRQIEKLRREPHFVIGTPGRLIDLHKQRKLNLQSFTTIVLDEVDQMLDMGFIKDMQYVVSHIPNERHSLFFSATLPKKLTPIVNDFLRDPVTVQIQAQNGSKNVHQDVIKIGKTAKIDLLHDLLIKDEFEKVLVFGRTKHGLNKLAKKLHTRGFQVAVIHGNKSQSQRQKALKSFKQNRVKVLLATDIASRGLDIDDVSHVINYDLPQTYEDYIHRIGRTGRAHKTGTALSFIE